jgi:hypothetical protein
MSKSSRIEQGPERLLDAGAAVLIYSGGVR